MIITVIDLFRRKNIIEKGNDNAKKRNKKFSYTNVTRSVGMRVSPSDVFVLIEFKLESFL
jgi:hypothetical protein